MNEDIQDMYPAFTRDEFTEEAIEAVAKLARHLDNNPLADRAWAIVIALKALRRPEMVELMERDRMERAR